MSEIEPFSILALVMLLFLSAFFSGSETAIIGSRKVKLEALAERGSKSAKIVLKLLNNQGSLLGTILVGNNLVNVAAAAITTALIGPAKATVVVTILLLLFGEIPPKTMASIWPERIARMVAYPIMFIQLFFAPVVWITNKVTDFMLFPFVKMMGSKERFYSREEIQVALDQSQDAGELEPGEAQMVQEVLDLQEVTLEEIMIPISDAACLDRDWSIDRVKDEIRLRRFTRYPVYLPGTKNPTGILHIKDILISGHKNRWQSLIRPLPSQSKNMDADDLLRDMQIRRYHMAKVVDDEKEVIGFVTMERILEEIVGEIADEHDLEDDPVIPTDDDKIFKIRGDLEVADVEQILNVDITDEDDEQTIAEFYKAHSGDRAISGVMTDTAILIKTKTNYLIQLLETQVPDTKKEEESTDQKREIKGS